MQFIPAYATLNIIYAIVVPYLPLLMRSLGYSAAVVGILLAVAEGAGILGPFLFGKMADRSGKYKGYIILGYIMTASVALPLAFFVHPLISAVFIALISCGYRSAVPLLDAITTINIGEKGNYGRIRVSGSISFVCFLLFLQWNRVLRPNSPLNIAIWISIAALVAIVAVIILPSRYTNRQTVSENSKNTNAATKSAQKKSIWTPYFIVGLASIALSRLALTPSHSFLPLFLVEYMNWDAVGVVSALAAISEIPFMLLSHRMIRRFGVMPILVFTSLMVALRLALYAIFPFKAGIITAQLLHSFCFGLFHPAAITFISANVSPEQRSYGMTLYLSLGTGIPVLIGNFIGGFIVDFAGYRTLFGFFTIFAVIGALIPVIFRSRIKPTSTTPLPCQPE